MWVREHLGGYGNFGANANPTDNRLDSIRPICRIKATTVENVAGRLSLPRILCWAEQPLCIPSPSFFINCSRFPTKPHPAEMPVKNLAAWPWLSALRPSITAWTAANSFFSVLQFFVQVYRHLKIPELITTHNVFFC